MIAVLRMRIIHFRRALEGKTEGRVPAHAQEVTGQQPIRKAVCDTEEEDLK